MPMLTRLSSRFEWSGSTHFRTLVMHRPTVFQSIRRYSAKLADSCLLLQRPEIRFLSTHPDLVCPSPQGPLPDAGSFVKLYEAATGRLPEIVFGKPNTLILSPLLKRFQPDEMVMVGDRLSTDKRLAENAGIDFILVLSGEAKREDLLTQIRQPSLVVDHLSSF